MVLQPPNYRHAFPNLTDANHAKTSVKDPYYNCHGHAAGTTQWWQPGPSFGGRRYWPSGADHSETLDAYIQAFKTIGYEPCNDGTFENGLEKLALFAKNGKPTHTARQLKSGGWTSKLGGNIDISHDLAGVSGDQYGDVAAYMCRPRQET